MPRLVEILPLAIGVWLAAGGTGLAEALSPVPAAATVTRGHQTVLLRDQPPIVLAQAPASPPAASTPPPKVEYDPAGLPPPVRKLREQLMAIAKSGDIQKLKPIIEASPEPPSFTEDDIGDPIDFLKTQSGDGEGREILAILLEILEAGYVHVDPGTDQEMYIWPYFARYPIEALTGPQMVELFKLITAGDYEDMKNSGAYIFYRLGIAPNGTWKYFIAGD